MSLYSAPLSIVPIFDASLFSTSIGSVQSGTSGTTLTYPTAQGAESWTNGIRTTTIDNSGVLITNNPGILTAIGFNATGFAYNNGFTTETSTWGDIITKQKAVAALSSASNSTTLNVNKTLQIQNGETTLPPTSFISLDASGNLLRMNLCQNGTTADYGTSGQTLLSGGSSGSLTWGDLPNVKSGETGVISSTTGTVTYASSFGSKPKVVLSLNTNGTSVIIPIALNQHTTSGGGALYTGFTWVAATTSTTATISWIATL